jgi:hypothetical protein
VQAQYETFVESDEVEVDASDNEDEDDGEEQQQQQQQHLTGTGQQTPATPGGAGKKKKIVNSPLTKLERAAKAAAASGGAGHQQRSASIDASADDTSSGRGGPKRIEFLEADFLQVDWSHGDLVFLNSTCYSPALMASLSAQAERLRPGALVVSLTKALQPPNPDTFELLSKRKYQMSWGSATAVSLAHMRIAYCAWPVHVKRTSLHGGSCCPHCCLCTLCDCLSTCKSDDNPGRGLLDRSASAVPTLCTRFLFFLPSSPFHLMLSTHG